MDKRVNNKGTKGNKGGRPKKIDEEKRNYLFEQAIKENFKTENPDESKIKFIKDLIKDGGRGKLFVAEHVFGKPREVKDVTINSESPIFNGINLDVTENNSTD